MLVSERVIEANILLSGLSFESGGLWIAHALTRGFTALPETAGAMHGEVVAFGTLVQLVLEDRPRAFILDLVGFYRQIGLPSTLAALGLAASNEIHLRAIAAPSLAPAYVAHTRTPVDEDRIVAALAAADRIGRSV